MQFKICRNGWRKNEYISTVKDGCLYAYPELTVGEAFEDFFGEPEWDYFHSNNGKNVVEFSGYCTYKNENVKVLIQFVVEDNGEFEGHYLEIDGVAQDEWTLNGLLMKIFED